MQTVMDLRSVFISNGVGIVLLLMLYYVSRTRILRRRMEDRLYSVMIFGVLFGCIMEAFSYLLDGRLFPGAIFLNHVANTYLFSVNLILPFCVLVYVDLGLYGDPERIWKHYKPQIIIGAVMLSATLINLFTPVCYYISDKNVYERRPFGYVYYAVILFYLISAIIVTRRYEKENGARTFFNINMFLVPILIGAGLQFAFYGLSLAWLSSAIGLTGMYMMQQNETAYFDPLVDTYNRRYLDFLLTSWISRGYGFSGIMLDIDDFKSINDSYGHSEGDNALLKLAGILKKSCSESDRFFRFAGDEFIVLVRTDHGGSADDYLSKMRRNLDKFNDTCKKPYRIAVSYGVCSFEPGRGDTDSFMKELDSHMYEMKKEHHGKK